MGDLTKNISRHEIACNCGCGFDTIDYLIVKYVQEACDHFAKELKIDKVILISHSGCRCVAWNIHEGGSDKSLHLDGRAFDHHIIGVSQEALYLYYNSRFTGRFGVGLYGTFIHFDTRSGPFWRSEW